MNSRITISLPIFAVLVGCASIDGTYAPDCTAYAGDNIVLADGRFTWDKFTDAIPVDDEGNPVDPSPGYPKQGSYSADGDTLNLSPDSGSDAMTMHVHKQGGKIYLLTTEQAESFEKTGQIADCALVKD